MNKNFFFIAFTAILLMLVASCRQHSDTEGKRKCVTQETIVFGGYRIPVFDSAEKQLEYARSFFADTDEQKAALKAVRNLFPNARKEIAEALVDLIYFGLGDDYRLSTRKLCEITIKRLNRFIREYPDVPGACAKAQWYIGWIYVDLLRNPEEGLAAYRKVVTRYPDEVFYISSPHENALFKYPENGNSGEKVGERHWWGALALLEIYRHTVDFDRKLDILSELMSKYPSDLSTGYALLDLLSLNRNNAMIVSYALSYIRKNKRNRSLRFVNSRMRDLLKMNSGSDAVRHQPKDKG